MLDVSLEPKTIESISKSVYVCITARGRHHPGSRYTIHILDVFMKTEHLS